jgi:lactate oxidase
MLVFCQLRARTDPSGEANAFKTDLSWADMEFTATTSGLPVIIKGITRLEDVVAEVKAGAAAVQVSNHGGRALELD